MMVKCKFCGSFGKHLEPCYESLVAEVAKLRAQVEEATPILRAVYFGDNMGLANDAAKWLNQLPIKPKDGQGRPE